MLTLAQAKEYLRVEYDDEDDYITFLIGVAQDYMHEGVTDFRAKYEGGSSRYKKLAQMCELAIVQNLYDQRYLVGKKQEMTYVIRSMMTQLEYAEADYVQPRTK